MAGLLPNTGNNGKRKYHRLFGTLNPARIVGEPTIQRVNGRLTQTVGIVGQYITRDGSRTFTREQTVESRFLDGEWVGDTEMEQRIQHCEALDGPEGTPLKPINEIVRKVRDDENAFQADRMGNTIDDTDLLARLAALQGR